MATVPTPTSKPGGIAGDDAGRAVYVISVAAELAGVHPRLCGSTSARSG